MNKHSNATYAHYLQVVCEHDLAFCKSCAVPYCRTCGQEWRPSQNITTTWPPNIETGGTTPVRVWATPVTRAVVAHTCTR